MPRCASATKTLRDQHGLTQRDIDGLSVRRLEQGAVFPRIKSIEKLARAHGMSVADYLAALAKLSKSAPGGPSDER